MTAAIRLRLDQATRTAVSERYEHTRNAVERTNCQIVLLADEGRHAPEIAWLVRRGPDQVRKVLHRFQVDGLAGLTPRKAPGRALQVTLVWLAELQRVIDLDPHTVHVSSPVCGCCRPTCKRSLATRLGSKPYGSICIDWATCANDRPGP